MFGGLIYLSITFLFLLIIFWKWEVITGSVVSKQMLWRLLLGLSFGLFGLVIGMVSFFSVR